MSTFRTRDLERRAYQLSDACRERAMGKSHALHVASRMLRQVAELIAISEDVDGTDEAERIRKLQDELLRYRAREKM